MKQLVAYRDGYYEFRFEGENVYDFECGDERAALDWIDHMARKNWVTKQHLQQFVEIYLANTKGGRNAESRPT